MTKFPKGSEWRKWDLHVHSPASALNNQFPGATTEEKWVNYMKKLHEISGVAALGITDYFSVDGYRQVVNRGGVPNVDLVVPNVELRILPVTGAESCINLHIIFDPAIVDELDSKFFSGLEYEYNGETYRCIRTDLIKLGKVYLNQPQTDDEVAYREGVNQFKTDLKTVRTTLQKNSLLANGSILVVSNNSKDGNSGLQHDGGLTTTRHEIYRYAHCIFSSNPNDADYFLGRGTDSKDVIIEKYGSLKPCIHGCDAHDLDGIGNPCAKRHEEGHTCATGSSSCRPRFCWIKADPTFEGLKQIIYEPTERVRVQAVSPIEDRKKISFSNFEIEGSTHFVIPDVDIPLNAELVTIIGGRGSGKSALLEAFAFLNEEHLKKDRNEKSKIIEYYRDNEDALIPMPSFNARTTLIDKDGNTHDFEKHLADTDPLELPFLYIGQESLSGLATNDSELTRKVCNLIGVDVAELDQQDLVIQAREILADVENKQRALSDIEETYKETGYDRSVPFQDWILKLQIKIRDQQARLSSEKTKLALQEINTKMLRGLNLKEFLAEINAALEELKNLHANTTIELINKKASSFYSEHQNVTNIMVVTQTSELTALKAKVENEMTKLREDIKTQKNALLKLDIKEDVNTLLQSTQALQNQLNKTAVDLENYKNTSKELADCISARNGILKNVQRTLSNLKDQIDDKFQEFKNSRSDSTDDEKALFEQIISGIEIEGKVIFNEKIFIDDVLHSHFDGRKIKNENDVREEIAGKNPDGSAKRITLDSIASWVQQDLAQKTHFNKGGIEEILNYIFTEWPKYIKITTVVRLNGKSTEALSIGQRGTLLLKVFLATATAKQVFIIDQPEDNLDNAFIMHELVPLIRKAKKSRQIIMSTHNANIVVNADAEQVIVARLDQADYAYISGGIEDPYINKEIKEILEGGEIAFRQRESKYQLN